MGTEDEKRLSYIRDLERLDEIGMQVVRLPVQAHVEAWTRIVCSHTYAKTLLTLQSILRLLPDSKYWRDDTPKVSDLASVASLSRNLIETFAVLRYMAEACSGPEASLRDILWHYHMRLEQKKMLKELLPASTKFKELEEEVKTLRSQLEVNSAFIKQDDKTKRKWRNGDSSKTKKVETICAEAGVHPGYFSAVYKYGSNHTHCTPYCLTQMADSSDGSFLFYSVALTTSAAFFSASTFEFLKLFPEVHASIDDSATAKLKKWAGILQWNVNQLQDPY